MGREIKFRAWDSDEKEMIEFDPDDYAFGEGHEKIGNFLCNVFGCDLMQYTGLKDRNGVEIYEGDVLKFDPSTWGGHDGVFAVEWDVHTWSGFGVPSEWPEFCDIIGNIYENPELVPK